MRRLIRPLGLRFRSFTTWLSDELWVVHDETVWDGGRTERRDGLARLVAPDRIRLIYDGMLGGTEVRLHSTGYSLAPYLITVSIPLLPFPLLVRCSDRCRLESTGLLVDEIDLSVLGVGLGRQVMRLTREDGG